MKKTAIFVILMIGLAVIFSGAVYAQQESVEEEVDQPSIFDQNVEQIEFDGEIYLVKGYESFKNKINVQERPVVGLALSGGGARAIANLGVLKALVENGVPIDLIAGTSMGSIIGSLYGSGLSISQIEEIISNLPLSDLFNFGLGGALINTEKMNIFLERIMPQKNLEDFLIPTAQLSFDLKEAKKFLIAEGNISDVLQATYSIPGYFPIHSRGDHYFMDAGVLEPSPAKSAALLGAEYIIATKTREAEQTEDYGSAIQSSSRFIQILQNQNSDRILKRYADYIIEADVRNYTFMDFNYANRLIEIGYQETMDEMDIIKSELQAQGINLTQAEERPYYNIDDEIRDIEFERIITGESSINPLIYYGRDYSSFMPDLIRTPLNEFQVGLRAERDKVQLSLLGSDDWDESYEVFLRYKKLTDSLDYYLKYKNRYNNIDEDDYESELKYFGPRYNLSFGFGRRMNKDYLLFGNDFRYVGNKFQWQTENDIFFINQSDELKVLSTQVINYDFTQAWSISTELVYNNSDIAASPLIYKGQELDEFQPVFQSSLHFNYNYNLQIPFQLLNFFQMTDFGGYLFVDYYHEGDWGEGAVAAGPALNSKLYLLGLKPIELDIFAAHDFEIDDQRYGIKFTYSF